MKINKTFELIAPSVLLCLPLFFSQLSYVQATTITSNTDVNQAFINSNQGPYTVNQNTNITFIETINLNGSNYFEDNGANINFVINRNVMVDGYAFLLHNNPNTTLTNNGNITGDVNCELFCSILTLNNLGTIGGDVNIYEDVPTPGAVMNIDTLNNSGTIDGGVFIQYLVDPLPGIRVLNNTGFINGGIDINGLVSETEAGIEYLNNTGSISGGINIDGVFGYLLTSSMTGITYLTNTGSISGGITISRVEGRSDSPASATGIESLINEGSITGGVSINNIGPNTSTGTGIRFLTNTGYIDGGISVANIGVGSIGVGTLSNLQGASTTSALAYTGLLPTNYNIIINSASQYGQLAGSSVAGSTNFGIYAGSLISSRYYSDVLQGLSDGNLGTRTGTYDGMGWTLVANGNNYDLRFTGINTAGTQASVHNTAQKLRSIFNTAAISTNFANMNTYDCNLFDTKGMCISAGGRYTTVDNPSANSSSAVVVVGYKATPNIRIGGFLDQNFNTSTPAGIRIANKNPMMGAFAVWNQKEDGLGLQVKVANAYQDKDVTTTRDGVTFTAESGTGATKLNTQSYMVEFSYAVKDQYDTLVRPYLALRYTNIKQDGYTETGISTPLTYDPLTDKSTTALFGVKFNRAITAKANITGSLGLEQDLERSVDKYTATSAGISGLTSENFNNDIHHTRPVASVGAYYVLSKTQRISGDVYYQQLPFQSTGSTTAYFNYMIGL